MKNFLATIIYTQKELWRSDRRLFILYFLTTVPVAVAPILWALANKELIVVILQTWAIDASFEIASLSFFGLLIGIWFTLNIFSDLVGRYVDDLMQRKYTAKFRRDMSIRVAQLDLQTFEDSVFIDALQRAKDANEKIIHVYKNSTELVRWLLQSLISIVALSFANPIIPVIILVVTGMEVYLNNRHNVQRRDLEKLLTPTNRLHGQYYGYFFNKLAVAEMKIYKLQKHLRRKFFSIEKRIIAQFMDLHLNFLSKYWLVSVLQTLGVEVGTRVYLFFLAINRLLTLDEFAFHLSNVGSFASAIYRIGRLISELGRHVSQLDLYNEFLTYEPVLDHSQARALPDLSQIEIEFKNVSFAYPGLEDRPVLKNFSLKIARGEKVALIGLNGAGKTTLIRLLLRLYDPVEGEVLINGQNIKTLDLDHYYQSIGILFQDYMHYELSVRDNVAFGNIQEIKDNDRVLYALEQAGAREFVDSYPNKTAQILGRQYDDSIQPSGGQWQKIALARTFFRNPSLLVLDEPTSSIDAKAEAEIFDRVKDLSHDKTVIIISHRFSTVRHSDRILVLEDGQIIEAGKHEDLLMQNGKYAELFYLQAKGYK
jgi:ATP-binding cassette subfamily B protein